MIDAILGAVLSVFRREPLLPGGEPVDYNGAIYMTNDVFRTKYRQLSAQEERRVDAIKDGATELHALMNNYAHPNGELGAQAQRYLALARTSLEESVMWAVKGVTTWY